jgi:hypothetical protein
MAPTPAVAIPSRNRATPRRSRRPPANRGGYLDTSLKLDHFHGQLGGMLGDAINGHSNANASDYAVHNTSNGNGYGDYAGRYGGMINGDGAGHYVGWGDNSGWFNSGNNGNNHWNDNNDWHDRDDRCPPRDANWVASMLTWLAQELRENPNCDFRTVLRFLNAFA